MIPLSRCIELIDYVDKLSGEQRKAIKHYLLRLQREGLNRNEGLYSNEPSKMPLKSKFVR